MHLHMPVQDADLDVWYTNLCVASWQTVLGICSLPSVALPFSPDSVPLSDLGIYFVDAARCTFGYNPTGSNYTTSSNSGAALGDTTYVGNYTIISNGFGPDTLQCTSDAMPAAGFFSIYIIANIAYSVLMLSIFRAGSSALFTVAAAARIPLVSLLLLSGAVAGPASSPGFTAYDGVASVLAVAGVLLYNSVREVEPVPSEDGRVCCTSLVNQQKSSSVASRLSRANSPASTGKISVDGSSSSSFEGDVLSHSYGYEEEEGRGVSREHHHRYITPPLERHIVRPEKESLLPHGLDVR